jgi:hypothetical protein
MLTNIAEPHNKAPASGSWNRLGFGSKPFPMDDLVRNTNIYTVCFYAAQTPVPTRKMKRLRLLYQISAKNIFSNKVKASNLQYKGWIRIKPKIVHNNVSKAC